MSRQQKIRDWMATQDGPRTSRQIAIGIGEPIEQTQWSVAQMYDDRMMDRRSGTGRAYVYWMVRDAMSKAETLAACAQARDARNAGLMPQRQAERLAAKAKRDAERAAKRQGSARRREESRRAYDVKRNERRKQLRAQLRLTRVQSVRMVAPPKPKMPEPVQWERPSTEAFLASGGHIERLDPGACSRPLRHIGRAA